jgi:hypothetical protein
MVTAVETTPIIAPNARLDGFPGAVLRLLQDFFKALGDFQPDNTLLNRSFYRRGKRLFAQCKDFLFEK